MDEKSVLGFSFNLLFFGASMQTVENESKIFLMIISAAAGITTIIYNIKKIKEK